MIMKALLLFMLLAFASSLPVKDNDIEITVKVEVDSEDAEEVEVDTVVEGEVEGDDHGESEEEEDGEEEDEDEEEEEEEEEYKIDDAAWKTFKSKFNKVYNAEEEMKRRKVWEENVRVVNAHNAAGTSSFSMEINKFADLNDDEFQQGRSLSKETLAEMKTQMKNEQPPSFDLENFTKYVEEIMMAPIPFSMDWRENNVVTPVKDQGQCGSCYAFAAVGAIEAHHAKSTGELVSFSPQQIVDCTRPYNHGCNGGLMTSAFEYAMVYPLLPEAVYPYLEQDDMCHATQETFTQTNTTAHLRAYYQLEQGNERMLQALLARVGPVGVAVMVPRNHRFYKKGLLDCDTDDPLTHAVLAVGYGVTRDGKQYYIVKNSWGEEWGMKGYFLVERNEKNACGIASDASIPL